MRTVPPAATSSVRTLTRVILGVFRVNGALLAAGDALVAPLDLTSARWQILGAIALAGRPIAVPEIATTMGVTRQGAQKQITQLLEHGLVEPHNNPRHRRSSLFGLTTRGANLYASAERLQVPWATRLARSASRADLEVAARVLEELAARLESPGQEARK